MKILRFFVLTTIFFISATISFSQKQEILAVANGKNYTINDLEPTNKEIYSNYEEAIKTEKVELLGELIAQLLFKQEAILRKIPVEKMLENEIPKLIKPPTNAEIQSVYDSNRDQIGSATLEQVKPQIIQFLYQQSYPEAVSKFVAELKKKHKVVMGKDVNSKVLQKIDVLAKVNDKPIIYKDFETFAGQNIYEIRATVYEKVFENLDDLIFNDLTTIEAQKADIAPADLIAREITDKMKDFSDDERDNLESAYRKKLIQKYGVKILLKEPKPFVQLVSTDDDPSRGLATAPVKIVMFTDFQCPACAAAHPLLKKVIAEYPKQIRLVVRDFPLTNIHQNAFRAAEAANAAHLQGKFFEYIEFLYNNQTSLSFDNLMDFAKQCGLNLQKFKTDLESGKFSNEINKDILDGNNYGVNSTPTIYVNGIKLRTLSAKSLRKLINHALGK